MKKVKNLIFAAILSLSVVILLVGCKAKVKAADILANFLLPEDNTEVTSNFSVQSKVEYGGVSYPLTWTSDKDNLVISSEENTENSTYDVTVVRPESGSVEVTLTVNLQIKKKNQASKDFKIRISPIDVYDFSGSFKLPQKGGIVYENFDLPTSHEFGGKTCSITWSSENDNLIKVDENKAKVIATTIETPTKLFAEFSYNNVTTKVEYPVTVYYPMTPEDALIYWYEHTGITQKLEGYVVAKGTYADKYGEGSLYVMDPSFKGGYYIYQAYIDKAEFDALQLGTYVVCTGATNTSYNGLMETNYGGTLTVDKEKAKINVEEKRYAIDNDLVANVNSLYYRLSTPVSLTNWKVKEVKELDAAGSSTQTILKLEKFGVETSVAYSKYLEATPLDASNDTYKAVTSKLSGLKAGDWVSIKGILSYYNKNKTPFDQKSYQINIESADSIIAGTEDTATTNPASKVKDQIAAVNEAMEGYDAIYEAQEITLPTSSDADVELTWGFANDYHASAKIEEGSKLIVTPGMASNIFLTATFKIGDYETVVRYTILVEDVDSQEKVHREVKNLSLEKEVYTGTASLPDKGTTHSEVTFTYELVGTYEGITVNGNKLTLPATDKEIEITLKVTGSYDGKTESKEVKIYLVAPKKLDSIKDVVAQKSDVAVEFTGTVVARSSSGYVLWDGTTGVYVSDSENEVEVGKVVKVVGIWGFYKTNARVRISTVISTEVVADAQAAATPESATDYDLEKLKAFIKKTVVVNYASFTGKVYVNGNYVNIIIDGSEAGEKVQGSITATTETMTEVKALNGLKVKFTGWLYDYSGNYPYLLLEKYELLDKRTDAQAIEVVKAGLTKLAETKIEKDTPLPTTLEVGGYDGTIAISWKNGNDAITAITYTSPSADTPLELVATIKAGEADEVTHTVTFTLAGTEATDITSLVTIEAGEITIPYGVIQKGSGEYIINVSDGKSIRISAANIVVKSEYSEFGPDKKSNIVFTAEGCKVYTLISDVFGTFDNMKLYAAATATGDTITGTKGTGKGTLYTYTVAGGSSVLCFDNPSEYAVYFFSLKLVITEPVERTDDEIVDLVVADLQKDATDNKITADKTLETSVTKDGKTVTLAWTKGGAAITTIPYTVSETEQQVVVSVTVTLNSATKTVEITYTIPALTKSSIAEVLAKKTGEVVKVEGTVVAVSSNGYVLWDGTDGVYVEDKTNKVVKGTVVEVTGTWNYYKDAKRVRINTVSKAEVVSGATPATLPTTATEYDLAKLKEFIGKTIVVDYATFSGRVLVNGNFTNIIIDGSEANETVQGSITASADEMTAIKALNGSRVKFTGWLYDASSGKFPYLLLEEYEVLPKTDAEAVEEVVKYLDNLALEDVTETKTLPASYKPEGNDNTATITWTKDGAPVTEIVYDSAITAETSVEYIASITLGTEQNVQHTVTFKLIPASTKKATLAGTLPADKTSLTFKDLVDAGTLTTSLGLDATLFTVTYNKNGASTDTTIYSDSIRMYGTKNSQNGNKFTVTAASNITINSIKISYISGRSSTAVIYGADGSTAITGAFTDDVATYDINGSAFTLFNDNSSASSNTQVRFTSIEISYTVNEPAA